MRALSRQARGSPGRELTRGRWRRGSWPRGRPARAVTWTATPHQSGGRSAPVPQAAWCVRSLLSSCNGEPALFKQRVGAENWADRCQWPPPPTAAGGSLSASAELLATLAPIAQLSVLHFALGQVRVGRLGGPHAAEATGPSLASQVAADDAVGAGEHSHPLTSTGTHWHPPSPTDTPLASTGAVQQSKEDRAPALSGSPVWQPCPARLSLSLSLSSSSSCCGRVGSRAVAAPPDQGSRQASVQRKSGFA